MASAFRRQSDPRSLRRDLRRGAACTADGGPRREAEARVRRTQPPAPRQPRSSPPSRSPERAGWRPARRADSRAVPAGCRRCSRRRESTGSRALRIGRPREPVLQQRRGGGEREERQADGRCQGPQRPPSRVGPAGLSDVDRQRQHDAGRDQHADVHRPLPPRARRACSARARRDIRAGARPGRRPCRCSRPRGCRRGPAAESCRSSGCTMNSSVAERKIASVKRRLHRVNSPTSNCPGLPRSSGDGLFRRSTR